MQPCFTLVLVLLPILGSALIPFLPFKERKQMLIYTEVLVILTTLLAYAILIWTPDEKFMVFHFTGNLGISFKVDDLGKVFVALVASLWPLATLYSFEYMEHEQHHEKHFYMFYVMTFGITLGIAMAADLLTMYLFYEMLTLITVPLIMYTLSREAIQATRTYMYYSIGGAAFAFIGMVYLITHCPSVDFSPGGILSPATVSNTNTMLLIFTMCFCGFSVKAAMFPFSGWLPKAGVAPTPVTALLHAVAVVKAGAFATMRITYYSYGVDLLKGTWAQKLLLIMAIFTIVYGCSRALKETHFKRRLAWSTVSNLSYILFGVLLMSPEGLIGGLMHMISHAVIKICAFFCAGAVICKTGRDYIHQLDGFGRKMPGVFICFTFSALALMGVPGLCGFTSKWSLAGAAVSSETVLGYIGVAALLVSALLTAIYMTTISVRAFFPGRDFDYASLDGVHEPTWKILLPLTVFVIAMIVLGLHPQPLINFFGSIASQVSIAPQI